MPLAIRRAVRSLLSDPARRSPSGQLRRFDLPLPIPPGVDPSASRIALHIEAPGELFVPRKLQERGIRGYEPATAAAILGIASVIRPSVVFDVGANVGPHALVVSALLDVDVTAFEPAAATAAILRRVVEANGLRCRVEELAVGATQDDAVLYISPTDTSTSLRAGWRPAVDSVIVPVTTLDRYIERTGLRPQLLKLDTETTEPAVLRGSAELLRSRPWIICEVFPGYNERELDDLLTPLGYRFHHLVDLVPAPRMPGLVGNTTRGHLNWLFAPTEPSPEVWDAIARWRAAIDATPRPLGDRPHR